MMSFIELLVAAALVGLPAVAVWCFTVVVRPGRLHPALLATASVVAILIEAAALDSTVQLGRRMEVDHIAALLSALNICVFGLVLVRVAGKIGVYIKFARTFSGRCKQPVIMGVSDFESLMLATTKAWRSDPVYMVRSPSPRLLRVVMSGRLIATVSFGTLATEALDALRQRASASEAWPDTSAVVQSAYIVWKPSTGWTICATSAPSFE